ncbi:MAG: hypothetical protein IPM38_05375 [Ignavibacteria bacterium]|nr:hypothetical protein [Ignavibacteria bacterium]
MKKTLSSLFVAVLFLAMSNFALSQVRVIPTQTDYPDFVTAFAAIQAGTHGAAPTATVIGSFSQTAGAILTNNSPTAITSINIYTSGVFTVTGAVGMAAPIITFNDIDNAVIDGSIGQAGLNRDLTFNHLNTASALMGIINLSNGSSDNVMRYCNLTTLSLNGRMINVAQTTAVFGGNDNNTIEYCFVDGGSRGIQTFGTAGIAPNDNTIINNNIVTNAATLGIFIGSELDGVTCNYNSVSINRGLLNNGATALFYRAIAIQAGGTVNVIGNEVFSLNNSTAGNTYQYQGIITIPQPVAGVVNYTLNLINNCVTLMDDNLTSASIIGIYAAANATSPANTQNVYNNTVRIGGTGLVVPAGAYYAGLLVSITIAGSTVNSYNNISSYERTANNVTSFGIAYDLTSYPAAGVALNSDYNTASAYVNTFGWDGGYGTTVYQNSGIELYKDTLCSIGIEQHTTFDSLLFAGANSCMFAAGTVGGNMNGMVLAAVPNDIDGTARNATYPYRGCYEGATLKVLTLGVDLEGVTSNTPQISVRLLLACAGVATSVGDFNPTTNQTVVTYGDAISTATGYVIDVRSMRHIQTWSASTVTFTGSAGSYNFTTSTSQAFGSNQASSPVAFYGGDVNQDGVVDVADLTAIDNDAFNFISGCRIRTDVDNNEVVDIDDASITDNNAFNFVGAVSPCGPGPAPSSLISNQNVTFKNINTFDKNILNSTIDTP